MYQQTGEGRILNHMLACDLTLPSPQENLACDEALLALCEEGTADEVLRIWSPRNTSSSSATAIAFARK